MYTSQFLYNVFRLSYRARKWYLGNLYVRLTPERASVRMQDGTVLRLRPRRDYVQREIYLAQGRYSYESHVVGWIARNLRPGAVVVDVGSHIGYYLGPVCHAITPGGKAFFLEPLPEHYELLRANIGGNGFACATAINTAVSDQGGETVFYVAEDSGRNSLMHNTVTDAPPIKVQQTRLDQLCSRLDISVIDLLQIDVEGAEFLVARGARQLLKRGGVLAILCELHPAQLRNEFDADPMELVNYVAQFGYDVFQLTPRAGEELPLRSDSLNAYQHLVFRLRGRLAAPADSVRR